MKLKQKFHFKNINSWLVQMPLVLALLQLICLSDVYSQNNTGENKSQSTPARSDDSLPSPFTIWSNNQGVVLFEAGRHFEAYQKFVETLGEDPFRAEIQYNLGDAFLVNKNFAKAVQAFEQVLKLTDDAELRFKTLFNLAITHSQLKNIDKALETYQLALEIDPESIEVKTNIELLLSKQQGGGGGGGDQENQDKKDQPKQDQNQEKKQEPDKGQDKDKKPKPQKFEEKELSENDVRKIFDELKNQEQQIRAKHNEEANKGKPNAKDW